MPKNSNEIPGAQKPPGEKSPEEQRDYSFYRDQAKAEYAKGTELIKRIALGERLLANEKDPETAAKIRAKLEELNQQKNEAAKRGGQALGKHIIYTEILDNFDPETDEGKA